MAKNVSEQFPLHAYQERAIKEAIKRGSSMEAIDMGLGKTRIIIEVCKRTGMQALVIAPMRVALRTWPDEIEKWSDMSWQVLHGKDKEHLYHSKRDVDFKILNYDGLKWFVGMIAKHGSNALKGRVLVLDESSQIKAPSTVRFKELRRILHFFTKVYCLSATPMPKSYRDLWSQYYTIDHGLALGRSMSAFDIQHCEMIKVPVWVKGVKKHFIKQVIREGHAEKVQAKVKHLTTRLEDSDYLDLPPVIYQDKVVELNEDVMTIYNELQKESAFEFGENEVRAANAGVKTMKLRQLVQGALYVDDTGGYEKFHSAKISALDHLLEEAGGASVLCPIQFRFELEMLRQSSELRRHCGDNIPAIVGRVPIKTQTGILDAWDNGDLRLLLCHPAALSHGLNLQRGGHIICWYSLTWNLEQYRQLIGRLARQGQEHRVIVAHIIAARTIDERVVSVLKDKEATQSDFLKAMKDCIISRPDQ